jgi:membrane-associated protease RseP (regulator of RpoE activity)
MLAMEPESQEPQRDPQIHEIEKDRPQEALGGNGRLGPFEEGRLVGEKSKTSVVMPVVLFFLTLFTTLLAGTYQEGGDPLRRPIDLMLGIPFSITLMSILFVHEMGHYLTSKRYGVQTTPPYFIPGPWYPFGIGTFGAFIRMRSPILKKNALLDIGAAGPIAGFVVSIFAVAIGLYSSRIIEVQEGNALLRLGDPLTFSVLAHLLGKVPPEGYDIALNSVAFAGWIGLFVTSLNLLPIGQLDGGHIAYALLGKWQKFISIGMVIILVVLGITGWSGWFVWAVLTSVLGVRHPPILDEEAPLDWKHRLVGWGSIALFIVTFMPVPFKVG